MSGFYHDDGIEGLARMPALSIDLCVISPPYGDPSSPTTGMRTYGGHPFGWTEFTALASELWRVTKKGGIVCWQEGNHSDGKGSYSDLPYYHLLHFRSLGFRHYQTIYSGMIDERCIPRHYANPPQEVWVLSKGRPDTVNLIEKPNKWGGQRAGSGWRNGDGQTTYDGKIVVNQYSPITCWWYYHGGNHTELPYRRLVHGGAMHNFLARDLITSYSNPGDLVCDPLAGLCTTGKWAVLLGRSFIGWEIHRPYWRAGRRRLLEARMQMLIDRSLQ